MAITILPYAPEHAPLFERLNREWIEEFFTLEPFDALVLGEPQRMILDTGGEIWFAARDGQAVGTAALLPYAPGVFEFTKLGVDKMARGHGVARALLMHCIKRAGEKNAHTLKIFTSTLLGPANALYKSAGFTEVAMTAAQKTRYARADIMYDLALAR